MWQIQVTYLITFVITFTMIRMLGEERPDIAWKLMGVLALVYPIVGIAIGVYALNN